MALNKFSAKVKRFRIILLSFIILYFIIMGIGYAVLNTNLSIVGSVLVKGKIEVTFDPDGGTVDNNSKIVFFNKKYGELPTPTRYLYNFLGWNGKNNFDYDDILDKSSTYVTKTTLNNKEVIIWTNNSNTDSFKMLEGHFKNNTKYMFSGYMASSRANKIAIKIVYSDNTSKLYDFDTLKLDSDNPQNIEANTFYKFYFASDDNKTISYIRGVNNDSENVYIDINSFLIEEGDHYTEYEPFYIDENTTVVQEDDHTLKAIWKHVDKYSEDLLNGADPVYSNNLVPITISDDGTVRKANIYEEWYSYEDKKWANAVVLVNSANYEYGEVIPMSNIESFFVWIPKYSYKIWDLGNYTSRFENDSSYVEKSHPIDIRFGLDNTTNTSSECATPMISNGTGQCSVGKFMTHPAFISMNSNGIWVGKFETGYLGATSSTGSEVDELNTSKIIIKPNVYSWRNITISNAYYNSYNYIRSDDSHLIKNTEWGAVAYLTSSIYGSCTGTICQKVRINNNSGYVTGYGSKTEPTCGWTSDDFMSCRPFGTGTQYSERWTQSKGVLASTTLNVTGIYDMSGGAWELVSGFMMNSTNTQPSVEGITFSSNKYYDGYKYVTEADQYQNRILGDAIGELGPFFNKNYLSSDNTPHVRYINSWYYTMSSNVITTWVSILRGGDMVSGSDSGTFALYISTNNNHRVISYRIVMLY